MSVFFLPIFRLKLWCCVIIGNRIIVILWMVSSIRMWIYISDIKTFFGIDNVVVPLICVFFVPIDELHQQLCIMALVTRRSSLASNVLSFRQHVVVGTCRYPDIFSTCLTLASTLLKSKRQRRDVGALPEALLSPIFPTLIC